MNVFIIDSLGNKKTLTKGKLDSLKNYKYLIVLKNYKDTLFERLQYDFKGPLINLSTYHDSSFTNKDGRYFEYYTNGIISKEGQFIKNKKEGIWYISNINAKPFLEYEYLHNNLINQKRIDSVENISEDSPAYYRGGDSVYSHMIGRTIEYMIRNKKIRHGGYAKIRFMIDTSGKMKNIYFSKSCNFVFDELCLMVMSSIPNNWIPATHNGKKINSYREQPLGLKVKDDLLY